MDLRFRLNKSNKLKTAPVQTILHRGGLFLKFTLENKMNGAPEPNGNKMQSFDLKNKSIVRFAGKRGERGSCCQIPIQYIRCSIRYRL